MVIIFTSVDFFLKKKRKEAREDRDMLDNKAPRSKFGPPSRGSSFFIENLLGTGGSGGSSAEERVETTEFKVTVHNPVICPGLETRQKDDEVLNWSGTFPNTAYGSSIREYSSHFHFICFL